MGEDYQTLQGFTTTKELSLAKSQVECKGNQTPGVGQEEGRELWLSISFQSQDAKSVPSLEKMFVTDILAPVPCIPTCM